jgi:16S rRNA (uracil1498-N3)-methyltransferase
MQRYFVKNENIEEDAIRITGTDSHHIKNVMRMKLNSKVYVCDEDENVYLSEIKEFTNDEVRLVKLEKITTVVELDCEVTIAMGLTKKDKLEEVVKKITELGASGFFSVTMERSNIKGSVLNNLKLDRLMMISKEASEQSHRTRLVKISDNIKFSIFLERAKEYDILLYAYEESGRLKNSYFKEIVKDFKDKKILVLVGPEGGISPKEVELLNKTGFKAIGLGPRILRCETAPIYIMSAISYERELV